MPQPTQFASVANVTFPNMYRKFLDRLDIFNFDLSWVMSVGCFLEVDFHDRLLWTTIAPVVALGFLGGTYAVALYKFRGSTQDTQQNIRHKHMSMALLVTFLVYSSVSSVVFQMFACEHLDDGKRYLLADYKIDCDSAKHQFLQIYAGFMVLLYPVGIPFFYAWLLFCNRRLLQDENYRVETLAVRSMSDLWKPYKPHRFYYEVVECGRRILLTGIIVFVYPTSASQIAVTLALSVAFVFVSEGLAPYGSPWDAWISRMGHVVVFASIYLALLMKVNVSGETYSSQTTYEVVLLVVHGCMVLAVAMEAVFMTVSLRAENQGEHPWPWLRESPITTNKVHESFPEEDDERKDDLAPNRMGHRVETVSRHFHIAPLDTLRRANTIVSDLVRGQRGGVTSFQS